MSSLVVKDSTKKNKGKWKFENGNFSQGRWLK
jgi:hypothetical protein